MAVKKINIDTHVPTGRIRAKDTGAGQGLIARFLTLELSHITDQQADLSALKFLAEGRHSTFTAAHDRCESPSGGDVGILSPPLRVGEIRRLISMTEGRISAAVSAMTTGTVAPEQITCKRGTPFRLRTCALGTEQAEWSAV